MSAKFVDALIGYEYYISRREAPTREEINRFLKNEDRNPISLRTYAHYHSLRENGFRAYIPINQFDVFQAIGKLQMAADRRRYSRHLENQKIQTSFDQATWLPAKIINESIVGFGAITSVDLVAKPGVPLWIRIEGHRDIPSILVWKRSEKNNTYFGIRALSFIAEYSESVSATSLSRPSATLRIIHSSQEGLTWSELFRVLSKLNELLDASQALIYTIGIASRKRVFIELSVVSSIRLSSPGDIQVKVDAGIAEIIRIVIEKIHFWGLPKRRYLLENERLELQNANLRLEVARNAINLAKEAEEEGLSKDIIRDLIAPSLKAIGVKKRPSTLFKPTSLETAIVKKRLLPAAAELVAGDDPHFDVEVYDTPNESDPPKSP